MATGPYDYTAFHRQPELEHPRAEAIAEGWTGWVVFAGFVMLLLGLYHAFAGLTQFFYFSVTPLWSLVVVTLGAVSVYAVAVHGGVDTLE
jgi:hypothetical protein